MSTLQSDEIKSLIRDGYNQSAQRYLDWTLPKPSSRTAYIDKLFTHMSSDTATSTILELGCGAGLPASVHLATHCAHLTANDISTTQLALARTNLASANLLHKTTLIESDMNTLTFPPGNFTAVVAFYSLIHLPLSDQTHALKQIFTWLKPNGYLVANFTAKPDPGNVVEGWLGMKAAFWSSLGTERTLVALAEVGFEVLEKEVVAEVEDGDVEFLWVVARKKE